MTSSSRILLASALATLWLLPGASRAGDLENFFTDLVEPLNDVLYTGTMTSDALPGDELAVFFGDFDPGDALDNLSNAAFSQFQQFPVGSTVAGFTYEFDPNLAIFVRSSQGLGPVLAERAQTNGKGKLNISFAYSRIEFDVFESEELDDLNVTLDGSSPAILGENNLIVGAPDLGGVDNENTISLNVNQDLLIGPGTSLAFTIDTPNEIFGGPFVDVIALDNAVPDGDYLLTPNFPVVTLDSQIDVDLFALFGNYGITDWLDVGVVLPVLRIHVEGDVTTQGVFSQGDFLAGTLTELPSATTRRDSDTKTGIGDMILRGKARLFETDYGDLATRVDFSIPTGDEHDLMGRGNGAFFGQMIVSEQFGRFSPHANLGLFIDFEDKLQNQIRYAAGLDVRVHERVTIAGDVVGSRDLDSDNIGDNQVNVSGGLKVNVWRRLILAGNALVRLNDEGLRADVIPSGSIEYTFF